MSNENKNQLRFLVALALTLVAVFFAYVTLTAPLIATTGPAIITVAAGVGAFFAWRSPNRGAPSQAPEEKTFQAGGRDLKDHS